MINRLSIFPVVGIPNISPWVYRLLSFIYKEKRQNEVGQFNLPSSGENDVPEEDNR